MGSNVFETEVGKSFREAGCFTHKFVDGMYAARPGDFLVVHHGLNLIIEAKMTTASTFPLSGWSKIQRAMAAEITKAGGAYWLLVNWRNLGGRKGSGWAFSHRSLLTIAASRGSLSPGSLAGGLPLAGVTGGWDVSPILLATASTFARDLLREEA